LLPKGFKHATSLLEITAQWPTNQHESCVIFERCF